MRPTARTRTPRVELLRHQGCPLAASTRDLLDDCLRELDLRVRVIERVGRYRSPTVLVDGRDVMGGSGSGHDVEACRLDVPTRDALLTALTGIRRPPP